MADIAEVVGFDLCDCPYCDEELPGEGAVFDASDAGRHFIWWGARLAAELGAGDPRDLVSSRVSTALAFTDAVSEAGVPLDERSEPTHLPVWNAVLEG
jgi:hypothetical protein